LAAASVALVSVGGGQALGSTGCDLVNARNFDMSISNVGILEGTTSNFIVGDNVRFVITIGGDLQMWL
jgi:hypothetical protein